MLRAPSLGLPTGQEILEISERNLKIVAKFRNYKEPVAFAPRVDFVSTYIKSEWKSISYTSSAN